MVDILSEKGIKKYLKNPEMFDISVMDTVTSTNALLKEYTFASEGKIIIADSQTMGRGRFARKFYSPESCGIYMSILLKPTLPPENAVLITAAAAAAVSVACERLTNKNTQIKWVNDVLIEGKKVCGILTEGGIDIKTGNFNPLIARIGKDYSKEALKETLEPILNNCIVECRNYCELLDIKKHKSIIDNILYLGLQNKQNKILSKEKSK